MNNFNCFRIIARDQVRKELNIPFESVFFRHWYNHVLFAYAPVEEQGSFHRVPPLEHVHQ